MASDVSTADECLEECQRTDGCNWFTHDSRNGGLCIMTEDCIGVNTCEECTVGNVNCTSQTIGMEGISCQAESLNNIQYPSLSGILLEVAS